VIAVFAVEKPLKVLANVNAIYVCPVTKFLVSGHLACWTVKLS